MAELQGPGLSKIYLNKVELQQDYPRLSFPGYTTALELSNFDVSSSTLKDEHFDALKKFEYFVNFLVGRGEAFHALLTLGFHSNTGSLAFNTALGEQRATSAYNAITPQTKFGLAWLHASMDWREGDPDGETGAMRKVLLLFNSPQIPRNLPTSDVSSDDTDFDLSDNPDIIGLKTMQDAYDS